MSEISDDAIILQTFPYGETSRILRLITAHHGVRSAIARGALRPRSRFGGGLEPFAEGIATLHLRDSRDLQTLSAFDLTRSPHRLGTSLLRFAGASLLAEILIRTGSEERQPGLFDGFRSALDGLREAPDDHLETLLLRETWGLVDRLGFSPALDECIDCGRAPAAGEGLRFDYAAGGIRCGACAAGAPGRDLPAHALADLRAFLGGQAASPGRTPAHWQLLRRHLEHHVVDEPLRAFDFLDSALALGPPEQASPSAQPASGTGSCGPGDV